MTTAEAEWRSNRMQHLLAVDELDRFEALAQMRQEAKFRPWIATKTIAASAHQ